MYFLYTLMTATAAVLLSPWFVARSLRDGKYLHGLQQRFGHLHADLRAVDGRPAIWLHAVSVGEVLAAVPLAQRLRQQYPACRLLVSTTTETGQRVARERLAFADGFFYFPLDWPGPVRRVLRTVRPALLVIVETEIWPHVLRECRRAAVPVVFVNGRVSDRSFSRYRRALAFSHSFQDFVRTVLADAALFLVRSATDADRLRELGAEAERVEVTGNLKYDLAPPAESSIAAWLEEQITRQERWPVLVAGSVVAGEEEAVLAAYDIVQRKWNRALLVLAPRKPERFAAAAEIVRQDGWSVVRRSTVQPGVSLDENAEVFLLDTVGELAGLYRLADANFIGGSLVPSGGHNILEPAACGKAPFFGPCMENFADMAALFLESKAAVRVTSGVDLGQRWVELISNDELRRQMGRAAQSLVAANRGATERSLARIAGLLGALSAAPSAAPPAAHTHSPSASRGGAA
jgi:3-deoxy-D-manno-octulosonic-acid transferase